MKVLLAGKVTVPKIVCLKEISIKQFGVNLMPLAIKKGPQ
jgi:hypothetical protein